MKVAMAADHAGWQLKNRLKERVAELGHEVLDLGTNGPDSVDYPDFGAACGRLNSLRKFVELPTFWFVGCI